jgi:hypothetical protein
MSNQHFHFDDYVVRPMCERDRDFLETLIEEDAYHIGRMTPDYFLHLVPGEDAWALEDMQGNVIFYFKTQTAVRVSIQFAGAKTKEERSRNRTALTKGLAWIEGMLQQNHFREMIFDTQGPELAAFAKRRLGFKASSEELIRPLPCPRPNGARQCDWGSSPETARREG